MALGVPVVFLVFNRPDLTRESFARIRDQQPEQLFVVADGPRADHPSDRERCAEVREVVAEIDWPCDVRRNYVDDNMGCKQRVSSGLDWVFSQVDRAIILEDDCVAHPDFFGFCDDLLDRYEDDPSVAMVTGDNFQGGVWRGDASYYFSKYPHIWGWATWKRAWACYDGDMSFWPAWRDSEDWEALMPDRVERRYWERIFDRVAIGGVDAWGYSWTASLWYHGGLTATPNVNLVANVGFGPDAAHTKSTRVFSNPSRDLAPSDIGQVTHPPDVDRDVVADRLVFRNTFDWKRRARKDPLGFTRAGVARLASHARYRPRLNSGRDRR